MSHLINTGTVPDILKISRITPIYKSGAVTNPNIYRPISVLSAFSKVLERIVHNQLESYLVNIIYFLNISLDLGKATRLNKQYLK